MCLIYNILRQIHLSLGRSKNRQMPTWTGCIAHHYSWTTYCKVEENTAHISFTCNYDKHVFAGYGEYDCFLPLLDNKVKSGSWSRLTQVDIILKQAQATQISHLRCSIWVNWLGFETYIMFMREGTLYFVQLAYSIWITVAFDLFLTRLSSGLGVVIVDADFLDFFHSLISHCFYPLRPCRATWCTSTFSEQRAKKGKAITKGTGSAVALHVQLVIVVTTWPHSDYPWISCTQMIKTRLGPV